ncbi:MAG: formate/nitrite transporter family protein [Bacteroidales bacterium]|nr:formate/nitrite transporter family protein [Bacteroidales bacterium]
MQTRIIDRAITIGVDKTAKSTALVTAQAIMAGMFISLGGLLSLYLGSGIPGIAADNPGLGRLLSGLAFPIGLFLIVFFGGELFTGNNALLIPALTRRRYSPWAVLRNWSLVWVGNFIGALIFTWLFAYASGLVDSPVYGSAIRSIAETKAGLPAMQILLRGIGANWCVCLAVWLGLSAETIGQKALACWIPVAAFVILGYEHSIANMFFIPCGMLAGADVTLDALARNLALATLGNIIGGALMVGLLYNRMYGRSKQ